MPGTISEAELAVAASDPPAPDVAGASSGLRDAVFLVLEGFTLPPAVRKILETAFYTTSDSGPEQQPPKDAVND